MSDIHFDYINNKYTELSLLGNSEKKSTWLAKDKLTGDIVVKKYISLQNASLYHKLSAIRHKSLIRILHVAESKSDAIVIMEYVSGQTIEKYLKDQAAFTREETVYYIRQLLEGLCEIHKAGIIHRDISPKNILISTDQVVKILDFDIGRFYKPKAGYDTTVLGTPGYAAPEQFGGGQSDQRADIYSVGILMNVMLTGRFPREYTYPYGHLGKIIQKCIQVGPLQRYQQSEDLLSALGGSTQTDHQAYAGIILPGFRSGVTWKKIVALCYYISISIVGFVNLRACSQTLTAFFFEWYAILIYGWLAVFIPLNFMQWMDHFPLVRSFSPKGKKILGVILWFLLFSIGISMETYTKSNILSLPPGTP